MAGPGTYRVYRITASRDSRGHPRECFDVGFDTHPKIRSAWSYVMETMSKVVVLSGACFLNCLALPWALTITRHFKTLQKTNLFTLTENLGHFQNRINLGQGSNAGFYSLLFYGLQKF